MRRGLTLGELLVALMVLILFVAITLPIYNRVRSGTLEGLDTDKLRKIYVALSLYESGNDGMPSQNLLGIRSYLGDDGLLKSETDPWFEEKSKSFPIDPEIPSTARRSPIRVSFSYLPDFVTEGKVKVQNWKAALMDPRIGILTCGWHGTVTPTGEPFVARLFGPVLRINMNGSLYRLKDRGGDGAMGNPEALFYKR